MPIKFRCPHCRQFLGISRSRAGAVVDCPTCGRSLRVPSSDGTVDPLPPPQLDLKDSALADALDELAMIGRTPIETAATEAEPNRPDREPAAPAGQAAALPAPLPEPIPMEPPLPAERIEPVPSGNMVEPAPLVAVPVAASMETLPPHGEAVESIGGNLGKPNGPVRGLLSLPILLLAAVIGVGGFVAGYLLGSRGRSPASPPATRHPDTETKSAHNGEATGLSVAVTGRITYKTAGGEGQPDAGARVILLPKQRTGTAKLSVVGLRPADTPADQQLARAGLRALGGDVATVDAEGKFSIRLPRAGAYHILILSHHQARDATDETAAVSQAQSVLEAYFDRPRSLLGRLRFHLETLRYSGRGTQIWDHSFERQL